MDVLTSEITDQKIFQIVSSKKVAAYRSFSDFEKTLFRLPVAQRNELFKNFLTNFLLTQSIFQIEKLFFYKDISEGMIKHIKLSYSNSECDGIVYIATQEVHAFKILLSEHRENVKRESIKQFLAKITHCDTRFVITNANNIQLPSKVLENVYSIRGSDFDSLSKKYLVH